MSLRGLYLHIPFCRRKCHYCDFVITLDAAGRLRPLFFEAIEREIHRVRERYGRLSFDTIYFGGGTPSMLSAAEMKQVLIWLRKNFNFRVRADAEIETTFEINPEDAEPEKLKAFRALGFNRASLGAQSFHDRLLRQIGREHTRSDIQQAVSRLREAGFENISLDLILKLPGQTVLDVQDSLRHAIELGVGQVSLYDLDLHNSTVFGALAKKGKLRLPEEEEHMHMYESARKMLEEAGYQGYELSNFAKPGFESHHNLIYWHNQEYLGLGPGAFSYLDGVRYQFASSVKRYLDKIGSGRWMHDTEDKISEEQREVETLLTGLRLKEGVDVNTLGKIKEDIQTQAAGSDLFNLNQNRLCLSLRGRLLAESAFSLLFDENNKE